MSKHYIDQEMYEELKRENKRLKQDFDEMKQDFVKQASDIFDDYEKVIDNQQEELNKQIQTIQELQDQIAYFSSFFGKSFEIAKQLYDQQKLVEQVIEVVNDTTSEIYYYDNDSFDENWENFIDYSSDDDKENEE
ncbi:3180_t:CDS:1 [Gigaspora margarita]|uniref:3180_t:CDS:1 n=1 Tax=Gigaspora margarita TaxID=4874 RepID=A0ABN7VBE3_GIGMA|nr:3180_t:CDS:1 [Gigaspora margarita]